MTKIHEIEQAITALPKRDYTKLREWFIKKDWAKWDEEIEKDSLSGKLDFLVQEAHDSKKHGELREF